MIQYSSHFGQEYVPAHFSFLLRGPSVECSDVKNGGKDIVQNFSRQFASTDVGNLFSSISSFCGRKPVNQGSSCRREPLVRLVAWQELGLGSPMSFHRFHGMEYFGHVKRTRTLDYIVRPWSWNSWSWRALRTLRPSAWNFHWNRWNLQVAINMQLYSNKQDKQVLPFFVMIEAEHGAWCPEPHSSQTLSEDCKSDFGKWHISIYGLRCNKCINVILTICLICL